VALFIAATFGLMAVLSIPAIKVPGGVGRLFHIGAAGRTPLLQPFEGLLHPGRGFTGPTGKGSGDARHQAELSLLGLGGSGTPGGSSGSETGGGSGSGPLPSTSVAVDQGPGIPDELRQLIAQLPPGQRTAALHLASIHLEAGREMVLRILGSRVATGPGHGHQGHEGHEGDDDHGSQGHGHDEDRGNGSSHHEKHDEGHGNGHDHGQGNGHGKGNHKH